MERFLYILGLRRWRPMLKVPDFVARIEQLLAKRVVGYGRYLPIDTTCRTIVVDVREIIEWYSTM
jgi:hypothetical protein